MRVKALSDIRVVEWGHVISGPFCSKILADLGAEVIKVEEPGIGDEARRMEPFLNDIPHPERSGLFLYLNTNKLGITLNLGIATGIKMFKALIKDADIFIENNPPRMIKELGIEYESLRKVNPRLIMTSITPFGQTGPYKDYKSGELVSCHMGGPAYVTPSHSEDNSQEPLKIGGRVVSFQAGLSGAAGTLCALYARRVTGLGGQVDVSELESVAQNMLNQARWYTYGKHIASRTDRGAMAPQHMLPCKDGYVGIYMTEEEQWQRFLEVIGSPDWGDSELFKDSASRAEYWDGLEPLILDWTMKHTMEDIYRACQTKRIPVGAVYTAKDLFNSQHLEERGFFVEIEHPKAGKLKYPGIPYKFSDTPRARATPAPLLGQHNEEIYCRRLGYTKWDMVKFRESGII